MADRQDRDAKLKVMMKDQYDHLRAINPGKEDWFRLSKDGMGIALFDPSMPYGSMVYTTYIGADDYIVNCVVDGKSLTAEPQMYEGFPDPPKPEPKFKVGDLVTLRGGIVPSGMRVTAVVVNQSEYTRDWHVRVRATDPNGRPGNSYDAAECRYELESKEDAA